MTTTSYSPPAPGTNGAEQSFDTGEAIQSAVERLAHDARADVAFATPRVMGDRTLIPVARVTYGFGGGSGGDGSTRQRGSGVGGGLAIRPFAVIEITAKRVRVLPIVDAQAIIGRVLGLLTATVLVAGLMRRPRGASNHTHVKIGHIRPHLTITGTALGFRREPREGIRRLLSPLAQVP